ncbi:MAG: hypothetical protein IPL53_00745 [Ignavibacteria bacterium]|nr:hypothetical protein [Ignavibacteria bacterium]
MKKNKSPENNNYGKYLFAGVLLAAIILIFFSRSDDDEVQVTKKTVHVWAAETDSMFVKDCYDKYKPQVKDDLVKQETMKLFCRCMLEKVKSEYDEGDLDKIKDIEIKKWDSECRDKILNSNFLK